MRRRSRYERAVSATTSANPEIRRQHCRALQQEHQRLFEQLLDVGQELITQWWQHSY
jgi:hypothetical protein